MAINTVFYDKNKRRWFRNGKMLPLGATGYNTKRKTTVQYNSDGSMTNTSALSQKETFGDWFTNATLSAAMAENPAVATAVGYEKDPTTGKVTQDANCMDSKKRPDLDRLQKSIGTMGALVTGANAAAAAAPTALGAAVNNVGEYLTTPKVMINLLSGAAGGEAINMASNKLTGKTVGQNISDQTNGVVPEWLGEFANPGYLMSGVIERPLNYIGNSLFNKVEAPISNFIINRQLRKNLSKNLKRIGSNLEDVGLSSANFSLDQTKEYANLINDYLNNHLFNRTNNLNIQNVGLNYKLNSFFRPRIKTNIYKEQFIFDKKEYPFNNGLHYFGVPQINTAFKYSSPKVKKILSDAIRLNNLDPIKNHYKSLSFTEKQEIDRFLETVNLVTSPKGYQFSTDYASTRMPFFSRRYLLDRANRIFIFDPKRLNRIKKLGFTEDDVNEMIKDPLFRDEITKYAESKKSSNTLGLTISSGLHPNSISPIWIKNSEIGTSTPFHEFKHRLLNYHKSKGYFISDAEKHIYNSAFPDINLYNFNIKPNASNPNANWKLYPPKARIPGNVKRADVNNTINMLDEKITSAIDMRNNVSNFYPYKQFVLKHKRIPTYEELNSIIDKLTMSDIRQLMTVNGYQVRRAAYYDRYPKLWNYAAIKQAMKLKQGNKITYNK